MGSRPKRHAFLRRICLRTHPMSPSLALRTQLRLMLMWAPAQIQAKAEVGKPGLDPTEWARDRQEETADRLLGRMDAGRRALPQGAAAATAATATATAEAAVPAVAIAVVAAQVAEEEGVGTAPAEATAVVAAQAAAAEASVAVATDRANCANAHRASGPRQEKNSTGRANSPRSSYVNGTVLFVDGGYTPR
jgi:hypothetical protein